MFQQLWYQSPSYHFPRFFVITGYFFYFLAAEFIYLAFSQTTSIDFVFPEFPARFFEVLVFTVKSGFLGVANESV